MAGWLDIGAASFTFIAALFWFLSAYGELPPPISYYGKVPTTDPLYVAVKFSAKMNRWGAGCSGVSALCMGLKLFLFP